MSRTSQPGVLAMKEVSHCETHFDNVIFTWDEDVFSSECGMEIMKSQTKNLWKILPPQKPNRLPLEAWGRMASRESWIPMVSNP